MCDQRDRLTPHACGESRLAVTSQAVSWARTGGRDADISRLMYAKTPLLPDLVGNDRRWVWIDDAHSGWDHQYLVRAGMDPTRFRLVRTDPAVGLM